MTPHVALNDELMDLMCDLAEDRLSPEGLKRLDELLCADPMNCQHYIDFMATITRLSWIGDDSNDDAKPMDERQPRGSLAQQVIDRRCETHSSQSSPFAFVMESSSRCSDAPNFAITDASYSTVGYFSSGMPLAYLVAAIILGIALWTGSLIPVSHGVQLADNPSRQRPLQNDHQPVFVGQITGMMDCQWADDGTAAIDRAHVPLGRKYALASGFMQITYDTGAKVILQGPCTYEVESTTGGFLSVGKLTARVEKKAEGGRRRAEETTNLPSPLGRGAGGEEKYGNHDQSQRALTLALSQGERGPGTSSPLRLPPSALFSVRTPTATVTDLGTEFGVEVTQDGNTTSHVFRGSVSVQVATTDGKTEGPAHVLRENESVRVEKSDGKRVLVVGKSVKPADFVRKLLKPSIKTFDLVDVVAGGDGFSKKRDRGIDPTSGRVVKALRREVDPGGDLPIVGNGQLHRVVGMPFVDSVFIPNGAERPVQIDSAGDVSSAFQGTANTTWQHIWAGGEIRDPKYPTTIGGIDYASPGHGLLLLHANAAITFDLESIRRANPGCKVLRFRAVAANTTDETFEGLDHRVDIWVLVDGQSRFQRRQINRSHGDFSVLVTVHDKDRFLTVAATDGGDGIGGDWIVFGDPQLDLRTVEASRQNDRAED